MGIKMCEACAAKGILSGFLPDILNIKDKLKTKYICAECGKTIAAKSRVKNE